MVKKINQKNIYFWRFNRYKIIVTKYIFWNECMNIVKYDIVQNKNNIINDNSNIYYYNNNNNININNSIIITNNIIANNKGKYMYKIKLMCKYMVTYE